MSVEALPLRLQVGARTIASIHRRLVRVPWSLAEALSGQGPAILPLVSGEDGWLVTSLPADREAMLGSSDRLTLVRQRYTRFFVDLTLGPEAWSSRLSANARASVKRKTKKLAALPGGLAITRAAGPDQIGELLPALRQIAAATYQARLLGTELPSNATLLAQSAADELRAWFLTIEGRPAAFLLCGAEGDTLRYDHCGHDPAYAEWSPGIVLQAEALRDLMAERRFARFDFLEGEGQHKRQLASGGVACCDVLVLRRTVANRALVTGLRGFDALVGRAKGSAMLRQVARSIGR